MTFTAFTQKDTRSLHLKVGLWIIAAILVHAAILFIVLPGITERMDKSYGGYPFADGYDQIAGNLLTGHGYRFYADSAPTIMREPGYPIFLVCLGKVLGLSLNSARIGNLFLTAFTAFLIFEITWKIFAQKDQSVSAVLFLPLVLYLIHPGVIFAEGRGGVEPLFSLLLTAFFLVVWRAIESGKLVTFALAGLLLGLTVLVRSTLILFPFVVFVFVLRFHLNKTGFSQALRNVAILCITMVCVMSPWIIRNYRLSGKFMPTADVLGISVNAGQYIGEREFGGKPFWLLDREAARERDREARQMQLRFVEQNEASYYQSFYSTEDEIRFSQFLLHQSMEKYRNAPLLFARCAFQNVFNFWFTGKTWLATGMNLIIQLPYLLIAALGAKRLLGCARLRQPAIVLLALIAYTMAIHVPILAQARYSIPLMPIIAILAFGTSVKYQSQSKTQNGERPAEFMHAAS